MIALWLLLVTVGAATDLDLAWTHDTYRMAGCTIFLAIVVCLRRDLTERTR